MRLHDGTSHHIALFEGDAFYTALLRRFATGPMIRTPGNLDTYWKKLQYLKSRAQRLSNKLVGRPATPETAILASMVVKLLEATQTWLGDTQAIVAAVLSSPDRIRLTDEEIGDIFDYLKLQYLMDEPRSLYGLYATSAAYAGYGKGLCRTYTDAYACEHEESQFTPQRMLHLDLNSQPLSGTIKTLQSSSDGSVDATFVDPDLGLGREDALPDGEQYWTAVSHRIRELVQSSISNRVYMPHLTELLLTGPSAANGRFQSAVRAALHDLVDDENVLALLRARNEAVKKNQEELQSLFTFATARGAAEIAKRRQEGPVQCAQSDECKRRRDHTHRERQSMLLGQRPDGRLM